MTTVRGCRTEYDSPELLLFLDPVAVEAMLKIGVELTPRAGGQLLFHYSLSLVHIRLA